MNLTSFVDMTLLATTFMTLFVIMDPPGTVPVFLSLTSPLEKYERKRAAIQATVTSFGVIILFAILGQYILKFLQISMESLQLSGGVLLFLVAMELLMGNNTEKPDTGNANVNVALVPLGTPLLAGPGAIVAVMFATAQAGTAMNEWAAVLTAVLFMHIVIWATMRFSVELARFLGRGGIMILTKISGLLLAAIATQMIMTALFSFVHLARNGSL